MESVSFSLGNVANHGEIILDLELNDLLVPSTFSQTVYTHETGEVKLPVERKVGFGSDFYI